LAASAARCCSASSLAFISASGLGSCEARKKDQTGLIQIS
jgi:hypothetical protein